MTDQPQTFQTIALDDPTTAVVFGPEGQVFYSLDDLAGTIAIQIVEKRLSAMASDRPLNDAENGYLTGQADLARGILENAKTLRASMEVSQVNDLGDLERFGFSD